MDEVLAQGMLFFIAGYDTTATSVAFLLYNLTLNPEIQEKLYEEIVDAAGDKVFRVNSMILYTFEQIDFILWIHLLKFTSYEHFCSWKLL